MGLFSFLQPKKKSLLDDVFQKINAEFFPNGKQDVDVFVDKVVLILKNHVERKGVVNIATLAMGICISSEKFTIERLKEHLILRKTIHYFDETSLKKFFILLNDTFKKPKEINWVSLYPKELAQMFMKQIKSNPQASKGNDIINGAIGEFALSPSNPVPVYGIPNNEVYLGRLRTLDGMPVTWNRVGSLTYEGIMYNIDNYNIFDSLGKHIANIYISSYHPRTSTKAPKGFNLI
jgi:hypothetical protein